MDSKKMMQSSRWYAGVLYPIKSKLPADGMAGYRFVKTKGSC